MRIGLVIVWEMKFSFFFVVIEFSMVDLCSWFWEVVDWEVMGFVMLFLFIWMMCGVLVIVWIEGSLFLLLEISEWVLMNCDFSVKGFEVN